MPDGMAENGEGYDIYTSARAASIAAKAKAAIIARDHGDESVVEEMGTMPLPNGSRDAMVAVPSGKLWFCKVLYDRGEQLKIYVSRKKTEIRVDTSKVALTDDFIAETIRNAMQE